MSAENYRLDDKRLPGINPVLFGQQKCEKGFEVGVIRPYWLLHYVISGKGKFQTASASYEVTPSQIFVIRPHQIHKYTADKDNPWHYMWVAFDSDITLPALLGTDVFYAPSAGKIFSEILTAEQIKSGKKEYVAGKLWELISLLLNVEQGSDEMPATYVTAAKEFIAENYKKGIKITDIAKSINLDRSYFSTVFKAKTGISPQRYLCEYRLERAAELLLKGEESVSDAAYLSGYGDIVNFSRMFKKHFGISPSKYKETIILSNSKIL